MPRITETPKATLARLRERIGRLRPPGVLYSTYEHRLLAELDPKKLPHHVAVMADGNRRWARLNAPGQPLAAGYRAGARKLQEFVGWCAEAGIGLVTLWVLSTDNLRRADEEELGSLLEVIARLVDDLADSGRCRVQLVGALDLLPADTAARLRAAEERSNADAATHVNIAISYGGRHELRDAVRSLLAEQAERGVGIAELAQTLEMDHIADHLYTAGQPDPDLVIRTSGEQRMSGFLIWQSVHSEFYFCEALWPDFRKVDFVRALRAYAQRERRFGR
ncbi:short-chain Z-isoprenyl diphosphate synthase [Naumannella cuiyingiana]|uniref:Isoprenyl transferase n=1 Tax=Naumannella cuiyingiana TaxID=1347891 RepID=A0A7Z0DAN5_9ACTN|nr:isoprenyl transferase [Naumannella cuiyingiana]NYI71877.1 short-chain Z-isoprenyl diphosphate synthase [Naumannella cuiyingiana]